MCALKIKHWKQSHQKEKQKIDCWALLEIIQDYGEWWTIDLGFFTLRTKYTYVVVFHFSYYVSHTLR